MAWADFQTQCNSKLISPEDSPPAGKENPAYFAINVAEQDTAGASALVTDRAHACPHEISRHNQMSCKSDKLQGNYEVTAKST